MRRVFLLAVYACLLFAGCGGSGERTYAVRGVVTKALEDGSIIVKHEAVEGFMPAMTMPFNVAPGAMEEARKLQPGDQIEFKLHVGREDSRADAFKVVGHVAVPGTGKSRAGAATAGSPRLKEGDTVAPFALVDQDGKPLTEADLRGKLTVLTFIFTRCPVPDFCPRMSSNFAEVQKRIKRSGPEAGAPVQLLSVTIDPEFDTPPVLRAYAEHYAADPALWRFATGDSAQIEAVRRQFAVFAEKSAAILDHTLATALIGPDLKVITLWRGNRWTPDEVWEAVKKGGEGRRRE